MIKYLEWHRTLIHSLSKRKCDVEYVWCRYDGETIRNPVNNRIKHYYYHGKSKTLEQLKRVNHAMVLNKSILADII